MTKRTIGIAAGVLVGVAAAGTGLFIALHGQFAGPPKTGPVHAGPEKNQPGDADDPTAYRPAPVSLSAASAFLFTGKPARQTGAERQPLQRRRAAVLRGRVLTADGKPLAGVEVSAPAQSEVGRTHTDADGAFDFAVNGGGPMVIAFEKKGFLPAWRQAVVPWQEYVWLPDIVLVPPAARAGSLEKPTDTDATVLRAGRVEDADGSRQPTLLAQPGLKAVLVNSSGDEPLNRLTLSVTEYSVGPNGASALPGPLPPGADYAYAVQVAAEEASQPGAGEVHFKKPLIEYVENFLHFPVGAELPTARWDADELAWAPGPGGRVVRVLEIKDGLAVLDVDGKGQPADAATLTAMQITDPERKQLAAIYAKDAMLWRLPLTALGAWAVLPVLKTPEGAVPPPYALGEPIFLSEKRIEFPVESVQIAGTPLKLYYDGAPGASTNTLNTLDIALTEAKLPPGLKRVDLDVQVAGTRFMKRFEPAPNQHYPFQWDGLDAYGRPVQTCQFALVRVGYVYDAAPPARRERILWRENRREIGDWDARAQALGGWTLDVQHRYDPVGRVLHKGDGVRREGLYLPRIITTVAGGTGYLKYNYDGEPAVLANLSQPRGLAVAPDGSLFIADAGQQRIRKVGPDGLIATVAGTGIAGYDHDEGPGIESPLHSPNGLAFGPDGSLYIADDGNSRVRRLRPGGNFTPFAGRGGDPLLYSGDGAAAKDAHMGFLRGVAVGPGGDVFIAQNSNYQCVRRVSPGGVVTCYAGGPAGKADLQTASAVATAPDGSLYVADRDGCRVWRIGPDGAAAPFAGTGKPGFSGEGGPAIKAQLNAPSGLAVDPYGSVYIADAGNQRIRRVSLDGMIDTFAGRGRSDSNETGDGGPATEAVLKLSERSQPGLGRLHGLAVGPDGDLYISDLGHSSVRRVAPVFGGISDSEILLEDGNELYVFDGVGRHLRTLDATTGAVLYRFVYDAAGRLTEVHDRADNVTKIERDRAGRPMAVVSPDGQRTTLELGADGRLSRIVPPGGEAVQMKYAEDGKLTRE